MELSIRLIFKKTTKMCNFAPILCKNRHFLIIFCYFLQKCFFNNSHKKSPRLMVCEGKIGSFLCMAVNPPLSGAQISTTMVNIKHAICVFQFTFGINRHPDKVWHQCLLFGNLV